MTYQKQNIEKICKGCGKNFIGHSKKIFCDPLCRRRFQKEDYHKLNQIEEGIPLNSGTRGAMSELLVSMDLFKKDFKVFRAISATASCDLLVLKNQKMFRVEVGKGWMSKGKPNIPNHKRKNTDILAIICNRQIYYENLPDLEYKGKIEYSRSGKVKLK